MTFPFPFMPPAIGAGASGIYAVVTKSADQTATDFTTPTILSFDTEIVDNPGWHDNVTNNSRLTVPSGVASVRVTVQIGCESLTANLARKLEILMNGAVLSPEVVNWDSVASTVAAHRAESPVLNVSPGDYFEARYTVVTDTSSDLVAAETWFAIEKVE